MKFDIVKKGYNPAQVDGYVSQLTEDNNKTVTEQKSVIEQLKQENGLLTEKLESYDKKKDEIFVAFVEAQETSAKLKRKAEQRFNEEMERLKLFQDKWTAYAKDVVKTLSPDEADKFNVMSKKFREVLSVYAKDVEVVQPEQKKTKQADTGAFEPLKKVTKFLENFQTQDEPMKNRTVATVEKVLEDEEEIVDRVPVDAEELAEQMVNVDELQDDDIIEKAVADNFADESADEIEITDISQSEIINVKQSLEDLCKELGIIDDEDKQ